MKLLVVIDMQNDFIDGALGTPEAMHIVEPVKNKIATYKAKGDVIIYTQDTHTENYPDTQEGKHLPVVHCVKGTEGWEIRNEIDSLLDEKGAVRIDKPTFGSTELGEYVKKLDEEETLEEITLIGVV